MIIDFQQFSGSHTPDLLLRVGWEGEGDVCNRNGGLALRPGNPVLAPRRGDLGRGLSDLEMTWLLYCAGAATA